MGKRNIGSLIKTATKNIHSESELQDVDRALASEVSLRLKESQRNWQPLFVKEVGMHDYQLIGSPITLEAAKLADLKVVHCIQIDETKETEKDILEYQKLMYGIGKESQSFGDLSPLIRRIDNIESTISKHENLLGDVLIYLHRLMPEEVLFINQESEKMIRAKLTGRISQIGNAKIDSFIQDILDNRPFHDDDELRYSIKILRPKPSKSNSPVYIKAWQSLIKQFRIDYSLQ